MNSMLPHPEVVKRDVSNLSNVSEMSEKHPSAMGTPLGSPAPMSVVRNGTQPLVPAKLSLEQVTKVLTAIKLLRDKGIPDTHPTYMKCKTVLYENTDFFSNTMYYLQSLPIAAKLAPWIISQESNAWLALQQYQKQQQQTPSFEDQAPNDGKEMTSPRSAFNPAPVKTNDSDVSISNTISNTIPSTISGNANASLPTSKNAPFTQEQLDLLNSQIVAYKYISRNLKVPESVQNTILDTVERAHPPPMDAAITTHPPMKPSMQHKLVNAAKSQLKIDGDLAKKSPYDAVRYRADLRKLIVPSIMPSGIDPQTIKEEYEHCIRQRMLCRIKELENLPISLPETMKRRALIEMKSLKLVEYQRQLRAAMLTAVSRAMTLETSLDRAAYRRMKKLSLKEARMTEKLEKQHRMEKEKKERQRHQEFIANVLQHCRDIKEHHRNCQARSAKLSRAVLQYHSNLEREEQKLLERLEKERIRALKADDEEAYLKLIDQKKDTRITHLLRQTDAYLSSLAAAVLEQKKSAYEDDEAGIDLDDERRDYYQIAHSIQEEIKHQPTFLVGGCLKEYQIRGLQWMVSLYNNNLNGILADEMGLGKTIQTIALLTYLIEFKKQNGPFIVVVPLSTLTNWVLEFEKWAPSVIKVVFKGTPSVRKQIYQQQLKNTKFNVLLTTYEYIIRDRSMLSKIKWSVLIVDEGHRMKSAHSKLTQILSQYYSCRHRLLLTGTPLQNNLPELWSLLNFILPKVFNSCKNFEEWFNVPFANTGERMELNEEEKLLIIRRLHKVLRPFLLRRLKKDVEAELPDKIERIIKCQLSALQKHLCNEIKKVGIVISNGGDEKRRRIFTRGLNNTIMQLRKVCNHPFVFEEIERQINPSKMTDDLIYRVSGKFELLDRMLPKFEVTGHKVLIFFQMTQIMTIMEDYCVWRGYRYLRLDGATKSEDRTDLLMKFNAPNAPYFLFLLSTRAGGLGLNLQSADTVVIFDSDWNPHQDLQAQDRAHRIGQTREVRIFRLISIDSVEEHILARAQYKLNVDEKVIQAGRFDQKTSAEEREAVLRALFEPGNEHSDIDDEVWNAEELNEVLARGDEEIEIFRQIDQKREQDEKTRYLVQAGMKRVPSRLMEVHELPDLYLEETNVDGFDEQSVAVNEQESEQAVRKRRAKAGVFYDDGLSEEQFLRSIEEGLDLQEVIENKRNRKRARLEKSKQSAMEAIDDPDEEESESDTDKVDVLSQIEQRRKRKMQTAEVSSPVSQRNLDLEPNGLHTMLDSVYKKVEDSYADDDRQRSHLFLQLPSKRLYPDYYVQIKRPIALNEVRSKIDDRKYSSAEEMLQDLDLMFSNALQYNMEGSQVYDDALYLRELAHRSIHELRRLIDDASKEKMDGNSKAVTASGLKLSIRLTSPATKQGSRLRRSLGSRDVSDAVAKVSDEDL